MKVRNAKANVTSTQVAQARERKANFLELVKEGHTIPQALAHETVGISHSAYKKWRERDKHFAKSVDIARAGRDSVVDEWNGSVASFFMQYFDFTPSPFQLIFIDELQNTPPGNILLALWPPEHGKTTTYENYATMKLATTPEWRSTVASENLTIATKIVSRVQKRLEPEGPYPRLVHEWGPFKPQTGMGTGNKVAQPWGSQFFNVFKKQTHDERDYSMMALGMGSSIVSTRTDHLHIDDIQSTKTLNLTDKMMTWFRQDALSRPGEHGITTIAGTRVGEDDFYERLMEDDALDGILKVVKFKAIMTDYTDIENPVQRPLWPERYTLEMLDRQRRKVGQDAWDRNYMQEPGASSSANRTFTDEAIEKALNPQRSLLHRCTMGSIVYVGLDPALGGQNTVIACELGPNKLIVRAIHEHARLMQNEQIMALLDQSVSWCNASGARVTDVVIEAMNFQKGLARDERLWELSQRHGFATREHLTGYNKYSEEIGIASMVTSFLNGEIELPWAEDDYTRNAIGELVRQLKAWRPFKRGNKLRQDRVMALWFVWILWRSRWKSTDVSTADTGQWRRGGVPYGRTSAGLVLPAGVRV